MLFRPLFCPATLLLEHEYWVKENINGSNAIGRMMAAGYDKQSFLLKLILMCQLASQSSQRLNQSKTRATSQ